MTKTSKPKSFRTVTFKIQLPDRARKAANDYEEFKNRYIRRISSKVLPDGYEERYYEVLFPKDGNGSLTMHEVKMMIEDFLWVIRKNAVTCTVHREIVGESSL